MRGRLQQTRTFGALTGVHAVRTLQTLQTLRLARADAGMARARGRMVVAAACDPARRTSASHTPTRTWTPCCAVLRCSYAIFNAIRLDVELNRE